MFCIAYYSTYYYSDLGNFLQLPWADYDNQYTIMYQLGTQKSPPVPEAALKPDGHDFLKKCFIPDAKKRWKAIQLLGHSFVKVLKMSRE